MKTDESNNDAEETDEDEDEDEEAEKSVNVGDLIKSLDALDSVTSEAADADDREGYLRARFEAGTLTKSEQTELGQIWAGTQTDDADEPLVKSLTDNEVVGQTIDASDFLRNLVGDVQGSLDSLGRIVKSEAGGAKRVAIETARAVTGIGRVLVEQDVIIKSLTARLEGVEQTPGQRRAATTPKGITKSRRIDAPAGGGGGEGGNDELTKSEIDNGIMRLTIQADEANDQQALNRLAQASATYSQGFGLPKPVANAILALRN